MDGCVGGRELSSPIKESSSAWLGEHISTYGNALVVFSSSSGLQRSGTGSHIIMGFGAVGLSLFRARRIEVVRFMQRAGEQMMWKDLENRRSSVRWECSRRSLGVVYLNSRTPDGV